MKPCVKSFNPCTSRSSVPLLFLGMPQEVLIHKLVFFLWSHCHLEMSILRAVLEDASQAATQERDHQFPRRARQTHWYRLLPYFILMCCSPLLLWTLLLSHLLCLVPVYHPLSDSTLAAHSLASKCHLPARTDYIYQLRFLSVKSVGWLTWVNWKTEVTFYQLVIARV